MRKLTLSAAAMAAFALLGYLLAQNPPPRRAGAGPPPRTAIRIGFGERQDREADYSGELSLSDGRVAELISWRFFGGDQIDGPNGWKLVTRRAPFENQPDQPIPLATPGAAVNVVPKSVTAVLDAPASADATVRTRRGNYSFRLDDLKSGRVLTFEDGDVTVQAVPATLQKGATGWSASYNYLFRGGLTSRA
jgi:hypothetical protein